MTTLVAIVYGDSAAAVSIPTRIAESLHVNRQGCERELVFGRGTERVRPPGRIRARGEEVEPCAAETAREAPVPGPER